MILQVHPPKFQSSPLLKFETMKLKRKRPSNSRYRSHSSHPSIFQVVNWWFGYLWIPLWKGSKKRIYVWYIFTYMKTLKINHSWIGKYTMHPRGFGTWSNPKASIQTTKKTISGLKLQQGRVFYSDMHIDKALLRETNGYVRGGVGWLALTHMKSKI